MRRLLAVTVLLGLAAPLVRAADAPSVPVPQPTAPPVHTPPPVAAVLEAVLLAAEEQAKLPAEKRAAGDALGDLYVRRAAASAQGSPVAFLVGLAHAVDPGATLARLPAGAALLKGVETEQAAARRREVLGSPTLRGRNDWLLHFALSAALVATSGDAVATTLGLAKELSDLRSGSGFSFTDLLADDAGIAFARWVLDPQGKGRLARVAEAFEGSRAMPDPTGVRDLVPAKEFERDFGNTGDLRYLKARQEVADRAAALAATWQ
jgi:hypothetical protein